MSQKHGTKKSWPHATLGLAAASLRKQAAIGSGHVRELVRLAVVLALAAPGNAAAASVPARGPSFEGWVLDIRGGGHDASQCGSEEAEADLHFGFLKRGVSMGLKVVYAACLVRAVDFFVTGALGRWPYLYS